MKSASANLASHLAQETTTLATCWKVTRRDSQLFGFTDHDASLTVAGVAYAAATGFSATAIRSSAQLNVDNLDIDGVLDATTITEDDLAAGRWDYAQVEVFHVNWRDLTQGILVLKRGWLGEISTQRGRYVAELRSLTQALQQPIGRVYGPECDADLGDSRCTVNLAPLTVTGAVTAITSRSVFSDSGRAEVAGTFDYGKLTWTGGANNGLAMEVRRFTAGQFTLFQPMPFALQLGDAYLVYPGCDKRLATCRDKFANVVNFRGFPFLPGIDQVLQTP